MIHDCINNIYKYVYIQVYGTKALQFEYYTKSAVQFQAVQISNAENTNALRGCFENIMIKFGYPLYRIYPNLSDQNSIFNQTKNLLVIGIHVTGMYLLYVSFISE